MGGLTPQWTTGQIDKTIRDAQGDYVFRVINALHYIGDTFQSDARRRGTYGNPTGNLRSSVQYFVLVDGQVIDKGDGEKTEAHQANTALLGELRSRFRSGIVLICMAGMGYAAYVEARGRDVITGSTPTDKRIGDFLKKACKQYLK